MARPSLVDQLRGDVAFQAFAILRAAYTVAPILFGIDNTYSGFYDIALRDSGLMLGALALGRLASSFDPPLG